jgi:hypothetical protein
MYSRPTVAGCPTIHAQDGFVVLKASKGMMAKMMAKRN